MKKLLKNVDEIDSYARFNQHFMTSFCTTRSVFSNLGYSKPEGSDHPLLGSLRVLKLALFSASRFH